VDQALAFLSACAGNTGAPLAPSELVDIGWHTAILRTQNYAAFCQRIAGRLLHHFSTEENNPSGEAARHPGPHRRNDRGGVVDPALCGRARLSARVPVATIGCHDDPPPLRRYRENLMARSTWYELPTPVRAAIERESGPVARAEIPSAGRNSDFSATLHVPGGVVFCKGIAHTEGKRGTMHRHKADLNRRSPRRPACAVGPR
jgi:hypothetical protein